MRACLLLKSLQDKRIVPCRPPTAARRQEREVSNKSAKECVRQVLGVFLSSEARALCPLSHVIVLDTQSDTVPA